MHFLRVNVTFHDAVNMTHNVISTANSSPDTAEYMFVSVKKIIKLNKSDDER